MTSKQFHQRSPRIGTFVVDLPCPAQCLGIFPILEWWRHRKTFEEHKKAHHSLLSKKWWPVMTIQWSQTRGSKTSLKYCGRHGSKESLDQWPCCLVFFEWMQRLWTIQRLNKTRSFQHILFYFLNVILVDFYRRLLSTHIHFTTNTARIRGGSRGFTFTCLYIHTFVLSGRHCRMAPHATLRHWHVHWTMHLSLKSRMGSGSVEDWSDGDCCETNVSRGWDSVRFFWSTRNMGGKCSFLLEQNARR